MSWTYLTKSVAPNLYHRTSPLWFLSICRNVMWQRLVFRHAAGVDQKKLSVEMFGSVQSSSLTFPASPRLASIPHQKLGWNELRLLDQFITRDLLRRSAPGDTGTSNITSATSDVSQTLILSLKLVCSNGLVETTKTFREEKQCTLHIYSWIVLLSRSILNFMKDLYWSHLGDGVVGSASWGIKRKCVGWE